MKFALIGLAVFVALFFGIAYIPDSVLEEDSRGNALWALCIVFGTTINVMVQRWLRERKKVAKERLEAREKAEEEVKEKAKQEKAKAKDARLLAKAKAREAEAKAKQSTVVIEEITDGSAVSDDAYRPKRKKAQKQSNKDLDAWDKVDYETELIKVNGDPRAIGELDKQEKHRMEMLKMYQQDPAGMEKAVKQAAQMKALRQASKGAHGDGNAQKAQAKGGNAKDNLEQALKNTGMSGAVFTGDDLKTEEGLARMAEAMSRSA